MLALGSGRACASVSCGCDGQRLYWSCKLLHATSLQVDACALKNRCACVSVVVHDNKVFCVVVVVVTSPTPYKSNLLALDI